MFGNAITVPETRRLLTTKGWNRAWIDGVTERVSRHQLTVSEVQLSQVLDFLESQGIPSEKSEHMSALSWGILGRTPDQMAAVIDYLKGRGIKDVATTLFQNPKLLEYDVAADGKELVKGAARIQVDVTDAEGGAHNVLVNFYRVGTTFKTAPISPWKPLDA